MTIWGGSLNHTRAVQYYYIYIGIMKVCGFQRVIYHPKTQLKFYVLTVCQYWLGIVDLKNVFTNQEFIISLLQYYKLLILMHSKKLLQNFKNFLLTDWLTHTYLLSYLLTYLPMPSDKRNSITTKAMGLIFALLDVTLSRDVPCHQPLQLQRLHHGFTEAHLCSPLYSIPFPLPCRWQFAVCTSWLRCEP